MLLAFASGVDWLTFPKAGASAPQQATAQLEICEAVTGDMDTIANMTLRATLETEQELGPDWIITMLPNGWTRFRLSNWPILQIISAQVASALASPTSWTAIPTSALITEHNIPSTTGSIVPSSQSPGATAVLIAPGYVDWSNGRKGYIVQTQTINGFPTTGMDQSCLAGAVSIHVDDITGWWNGTLGALGTIYDPPFHEHISVVGTNPDAAGAISGPGVLTLSQGLQFAHTPQVGSGTSPDLRVLVSCMPPALIQAGYYLATYYGLIRGSTAAVMQSARGVAAPSGVARAQSWYTQAESIIKRYARVL
jgi:hypothetical protein